MARLNNTLSPPMPIQLEPDSDWFDYGDDYIEDIRVWIANGALDVMGQAPTVTAHPFSLAGVFAMQSDSIYRRYDTRAPLRLPADSLGDSYVYVALSHPDRDLSELEGEVQAGFSTEIDPFKDSISYTVEYLPVPYMYYGIHGEEVAYHFRIKVNADDFKKGEAHFLRLFISYGEDEIPFGEALFHIQKYYSLEWI